MKNTIRSKRTLQLCTAIFLTLTLSACAETNANAASEDATKPPTIVVYKSPTCGCCAKWNDHLTAAGFVVESHDSEDMNAIKDNYAIPAELRSCHTAKIGNYYVEGHVPASDILRLLKEQPAAAGIAVPGMPLGSPGMEHVYKQPYEVIAWSENGNRSVFSRHQQEAAQSGHKSH